MCVNCNDEFLTRGEVLKLIQDFGVPKGGMMFIATEQYTAINFDITGLGKGIYEGWAIANGNNQTENVLGKFIYAFDPSNLLNADDTGGAEEVTLQTSDLPVHRHLTVEENTSLSAVPMSTDPALIAGSANRIMGTDATTNIVPAPPAAYTGDEIYEDVGGAVTQVSAQTGVDKLPPYIVKVPIQKL